MGVITRWLRYLHQCRCLCWKSTPCYTGSGSYQRSSYTVHYLTFTGAGVCVERVPCVTQTVDYLTFTGAGVCVERVPLVTQTAITAKRVLTQLRTRTVVALVHVWKSEREKNAQSNMSTFIILTHAFKPSQTGLQAWHVYVIVCVAKSFRVFKKNFFIVTMHSLSLPHCHSWWTVMTRCCVVRWVAV